MDTALVMIDFQKDYFPEGRMELVGAEAAAARAQELLQHCRQLELPVVYLQHISVQPGATFFLPETGGIDLHGSLQPLGSETVLRKHYPNSFRDTGLKALIWLTLVKNKDVSATLFSSVMPTIVRGLI